MLPRIADARRVPRLLEALGLAFVALIVVEWAAVRPFGLADGRTVHYLLSFVFNGVPALGIGYAGYRLERSDIETDQYRRVARWCLGGAVGFFGLNLGLIAVWSTGDPAADVGWARGAAIYGAAGGLLVGGIEARAIHRARTAERRIAHADHLETQHRWLSYMNSLLRHEVLNTANVIDGYAGLLLAETRDERSRDHLETIRRQSRGMSAVIEEAQTLLEATDAEGSFERVDLSVVVAEQVADLRARHDVEVETRVPDGLVVTADDLCPRIFSNLFTNAVKHNDAGTPRISVRAETRDGTVTVVVRDDGPGVPEARRGRLFEGETRTRTHGLGLHLVRTLAERYGGTVELRETGPDGSAFAVSLPLAADGGSASHPASTAADAARPGTRGATGNA